MKKTPKTEIWTPQIYACARTYTYIYTYTHLNTSYTTHTHRIPRMAGGMKANIKVNTIETSLAGAGLRYAKRTGYCKAPALAAPRPVSLCAELQRNPFRRNKSYECRVLA